jgi:hypothetical protein
MSSLYDRKLHLTLDSLPSKLILSISNYLLPPDLICVSLCNKQFYHLLSRQRQQVTPTKTEKLLFLARYEHDHPEYFTCEICMILHRYDGSESFGLAAGRRMNQLACRLPCVRSGQWVSPARIMEDHIWTYHAQTFSFLHLKLAMKGFRHGEKYGISSDSLLHKQVITDNGNLFLFSRDAEVCPKPRSLYVRRQNIIVTKLAKFRASRLPRGRLIPCFGADLYTLVQGILIEFEEFKAVSFTYNCDVCKTDIEVEVREFSPSSNMIAIIITRWTSLGPGLTQEDELWKAHIRISGERMENHARLSDRPSHALENGGRPLSKKGRIIQYHRATFEDITRFSYNELKFINLSYLRNDDYQYTMEEVAKNNWTILFKESEGRFNKLWQSYCRHRSFRSSWRVAKESVIANEIVPVHHITTFLSRKSLFETVFMPVGPPRYSELLPPPPSYASTL